MARHTITIPDYLPIRLNVLLRSHWAVRHRATKEAKDFVAAYGVAVPKAAVKRRVWLVFRSPRGGADPDARLKLILDGLVAFRLLVDDSQRWCEVPPARHERGKRKETEITLEDIE